VQHSGFGYGANPQFERGLEVRELGIHGEPLAREQKRVRDAGGVVFDSYEEAVAFEESAPYPADYAGLTPRVAGDFSEQTIDGLRIYMPVRVLVG
jgi:hypothetical protein